MLIKERDDKSAQIQELKSLLEIATEPQLKRIEEELRNLIAGERAEKDAAYLIDFDSKNLKNRVVLHDLRLDINGRIAQIDHLIIFKTLDVFVFESKSFHAGLKITDDGEFLRWNGWKKAFEGMPSPLAQNDRHIAVLKDAFNQMDLPSRLGIKMSPALHSVVLIDSKARIDRPKRFDTSNVIKADMLPIYLDKFLDKKTEGLKAISALAKLVSAETIQQLAKGLASLHKPLMIDYKAKFGITGTHSVIFGDSSVASDGAGQTKPKNSNAPVCRSCSSTNLSILYGKFGYYFKCADCDGNTPIKIGCGKEGHKERLRKEGLKFFRECADCGTSALYYANQ